MGLKKQPARSGVWTRSGAVQSMTKGAETGTAVADVRDRSQLKSPAELCGEKTWKTFTKKWNSRVAALLPVTANVGGVYSHHVVDSAKKLLESLETISHSASPLALAYRSKDLSLKPGVGFECRQRPAAKSMFFRSFENIASSVLDPESTLQGGSSTGPHFLSENDVHPSSYDVLQFDVENVLHHGLHKTARSGLVGEVMLEQMRSQLRPLLTGHRSRNLRHVHLHCDVGTWTVAPKAGTQAGRDSTVIGAAVKEGLGFNETVTASCIPRSEKDAFTSGYLFYGCLAAMELCKLYDEGSGGASQCRDLEVYLHGGCFAVADEAVGSPVDSLAILRCPPACDARVLIFCKERPVPVIVAECFQLVSQCTLVAHVSEYAVCLVYLYAIMARVPMAKPKHDLFLLLTKLAGSYLSASKERSVL